MRLLRDHPHGGERVNRKLCKARRGLVRLGRTEWCRLVEAVPLRLWPGQRPEPPLRRATRLRHPSNSSVLTIPGLSTRVHVTLLHVDGTKSCELSTQITILDHMCYAPSQGWRFSHLFSARPGARAIERLCHRKLRQRRELFNNLDEGRARVNDRNAIPDGVGPRLPQTHSTGWGHCQALSIGDAPSDRQAPTELNQRRPRFRPPPDAGLSSSASRG